MAFTEIGANTLDGAYSISNSLRFNEPDDPQLSITPSSAGNRRTWTVSFWHKVGKYNTYRYVFLSGASAPYDAVFITPDGGFALMLDLGSSGDPGLTSSALCRDPSAWYHFVCALDTTQGTAANRIKLYINGVQQTSFSATNYPDQNSEFNTNNTVLQTVGGISAQEYVDGYVSEFFLIDGTAYAASDFGEFNDNGIWIPKDFTGSYGTNGFRLEFKQTGTSANASGIGADTSGNDKHLAVSNLAATDVTTDTPTNNFCTMNPIDKSVGASVNLPTFTEGNLKLALQQDASARGTIGLTSGKWYFEYNHSENGSDNSGYPIVGITTSHGGQAGNIIGFRTPDSTNYRGQKGTSSLDNVFLSAREAGDLFGFYIDLDNETLIVHKDGSTYMASGYTSGIDWSSGLTTTDTQTGFFFPYVQNNASSSMTDEFNFGNPSFSISSGNADANGYGNFEYSPTLSGTNYYAICTKNLAEFVG